MSEAGETPSLEERAAWKVAICLAFGVDEAVIETPPGDITLDMVRQARVEHELIPWMRMFAEQGDV